MINPEDDVILDLSTSCTQEVAVMKLLGWSRGPLLRRQIRLTEDGISEDQMPFIPLNQVSLAEQLIDMREVARKELLTASENDEPHDVLASREKAVQRYEDLIRRAHEFSLDITDALNGEDQGTGESSRLALDQVKTRAEGVPYISLRSLDRWAQKKYGFSIASSAPAQTEAGLLPPNAPGSPVEESANLAGVGNVESLAVTFAFLAEAYAKKHPQELLIAGEKFSALALSQELAEIISKATQKNPPRGQGDEAIRKRITAALKIKDQKLRSR